MGALAERGFHQLLKLAVLVKLAHDIAPADELAVDVDLRDRRPVAVALDRLPQLLVGKHAEGLERRAERLEDLYGRSREAALRKVAVAFHEKDDLVLFDRRLD